MAQPENFLNVLTQTLKKARFLPALGGTLSQEEETLLYPGGGQMNCIFLLFLFMFIWEQCCLGLLRHCPLSGQFFFSSVVCAFSGDPFYITRGSLSFRISHGSAQQLGPGVAFNGMQSLDTPSVLPIRPYTKTTEKKFPIA